GMTGGQMAPTTLPGQVSTTSPYGRNIKIQGHPIRICEMLSTLDGTAYAERVSVDSFKNIKKAKSAIKKAFEIQQAGLGFSIVEVLSTCPTNWGKTPTEALEWLRTDMIPYYPLGVYKDITAKGENRHV
ncbi:MAG TPA: 2-oxoglutarate oxidoreductase, partial [Clostridiales bacterium]|nr:2-oxoglutarate oxidoreductase [Clostridiales bacterium]